MKIIYDFNLQEESKQKPPSRIYSLILVISSKLRRTPEKVTGRGVDLKSSKPRVQVKLLRYYYHLSFCRNWQQDSTPLNFCFLIFCDKIIFIAVPSKPVGLNLRLVQDNPPVVAVQWHSPRQSFGNLEAFKLSYGIQGEDSSTEERRFDSDKFRFTTGFLGMN